MEATVIAGGPLEDQLNFYRHKMTQHESERVEWQEQADAARADIEKVHRLEQEVHDTKKQIAELQKALSDSHLSIYDEKSYLFQLQRDQQLLKTQERNDAQKKAELESITNALDEEDLEDPRQGKYVNFKDCRPRVQAKRTAKKLAKADANLKPPPTQKQVLTNTLIKEKLQESNSQVAVAKPAAAKGSARSKLSSQASSRSKGGGVIKTIVLPHEDINRLGTEAQELGERMARQSALFEDTVAGYQKDRSVRMQEFDLKAQDFENTIRELEGRLEAQKKLNYEVSSDYFNYKHAVQLAKGKLED